MSFHTPAHKNTQHPAGQDSLPAKTTNRTPTPVHPSKWVVMPRRWCDIPGSGSRSKRDAYCVYRAGQYMARFGRRRDAEAFRNEQVNAEGWKP